MSQNLRQIKSRINSTENTKKIMRAMEMVSVSKLRRIENSLRFSQNYFHKLDQLFHRLTGKKENREHPVFKRTSDARRILACVFTSDTGLCGAYNNRILDLTKKFTGQLPSQKELQFVAIGKKGFKSLRQKEYPVLKSYLDLYGRFSGKLAEGISSDLYNIFTSESDVRIVLIYTRYKSALRLEPVVEELIDLTNPVNNPNESSIEYILEPNASRIFEDLLPEYVRAKIHRAMLEAFMSEHSARIVAMKQATDNAKELLETLVLLRNRLRQYSITKEVIEIISSSEALKG